MNVVFIGECSIDEYYGLESDWPSVGGKAKVRFDGNRYGGMVANAAAVFAGYGGHAVLLAGLNKQDPNTPNIISDLKEYGVDTTHIALGDNTETPKCLIVTDRRERIIYAVTPKSDVSYLKPFDKTHRLIADADFVYSAIREIRVIDKEDHALDSILENSGTRLFIDCDAHVEIEDMPILQKADVISFNEFGFQKFLSVMSIEDLKDSFFTQGKIEHIIITRGINGCTVLTQSNEYEMEAFRKEIPPIDTTGAGDAFNSTFLFAKLSGMSLDESMRIANKAGFKMTTKIGPRSRISLDELKSLS